MNIPPNTHYRIHSCCHSRQNLWLTFPSQLLNLYPIQTLRRQVPHHSLLYDEYLLSDPRLTHEFLLSKGLNLKTVAVPVIHKVKDGIPRTQV